MNWKYTLAAFPLLAVTACAPIHAATVNQATGSDAADPAQVVRSADDGWIAFGMPALEGTRSPCCWKGIGRGGHAIGCSLEKRSQSYGTMSDSPLEENLLAYARVRNGQVDRLKIIGEQCPMDTTGQSVTFVRHTEDRAMLAWLERLATDDPIEPVGDHALWGIALHASPAAGDRLYRLAQSRSGERSREAIFWLGEARGEAGCAALAKLLKEIPAGETRQHINFALSQNDSKQATRLLADIAQNDRDPEQRADALFWLAEEHPETAKELIMDVIETETDHEMLERAVFAMSQLPDDVAGPMLLDLARNDSAPREARRQALFWLAQSGDDDSVARLTELLTH